MSFGFGVSLVCDDLAAFPEWVRTVDECGYDVIGLTDYLRAPKRARQREDGHPQR